MDSIMVFSIILIFGGIGMGISYGIGYAVGFRKGVERERQRRAEKEETYVYSL